MIWIFLLIPWIKTRYMFCTGMELCRRSFDRAPPRPFIVRCSVRANAADTRALRSGRRRICPSWESSPHGEFSLFLSSFQLIDCILLLFNTLLSKKLSSYVAIKRLWNTSFSKYFFRLFVLTILLKICCSENIFKMLRSQNDFKIRYSQNTFKIFLF